MPGPDGALVWLIQAEARDSVGSNELLFCQFPGAVLLKAENLCNQSIEFM